MRLPPSLFALLAAGALVAGCGSPPEGTPVPASTPEYMTETYGASRERAGERIAVEGYVWLGRDGGGTFRRNETTELELRTEPLGGGETLAGFMARIGPAATSSRSRQAARRPT